MSQLLDLVPRSDAMAFGRAVSPPASPAVLMRSAERAEIDPEAAELVARARRGGASLDEVLRSQLEAALGVRLDDVRVHADAEADAAARALGAQAFAIGDDVFFREGAYAPQRQEGQRLIAHEVAHTVQARCATAPADGAISQPGDSIERDADAFADAFIGSVGIGAHTDADAAGSANRPGARADTVGSDIVSGERQDALGTGEGSAPGAHGLAHAVLQPRTGQPASTIQRQTGPQTFSVPEAEFANRIREGIALISGRVVGGDTLSETMRPILEAALPQATFRDSAGTVHGGGPVQMPHPGLPGTTISLQFIFDDAIGDTRAGSFQPTGTTQGTITLFMRNIPDRNEASLTIFHEASHMMAWLIRQPGSQIAGPHRAIEVLNRVDRATVREIGILAPHLSALAQSIAARRAPGAAMPITPAAVEQVARFLVEEVHVRAVTEIFRLGLDRQVSMAPHGPLATIGALTSPNNIAWTDIDMGRYLFIHAQSPLFTTGDQAQLDSLDLSTFHMVGDILRDVFRSVVTQGFQHPETLHIPRATDVYTPPPFEPPPFRRLPLP
ncbi:MAG: DUF4157 domain-containing protein [Deltaproteobacteria bacterium]|nr:MAG: DUF4157 domain-containing protein [Deltaproteobacteria bacterium]